MRNMKKLIFNIYNRTIGNLLLLSQNTLRVQSISQRLFDVIDQQVLQDCAQYALNNFSNALRFRTRQEMWSFCLKKIHQVQPSGDGIIAEFGVWSGTSINFFAKNSPKSRLFGFDSFEGLEEDWVGRNLQKGSFNRNGELPKVESNVKLTKGWFEDTVPEFVNKLSMEKILLVHMDADTYKPTKFVLNSIIKNLGKGSILIFDEYFGYSGWKLHEFKAWQETVEFYDIQYRYIGYSSEQVAIEIL